MLQQGGALGGCIHAAAGSASWIFPPPVNRMTHACENITFATLLHNAVGKKSRSERTSPGGLCAPDNLIG